MKYVRYAIIALAPIMLALGIWLFIGSNKSPVPRAVMVMDVLSGEVFEASRRTLLVIPGKNDNGIYSLFPVQQVDGRWQVIERYRPSLTDLKSNPALKVDPATGRLKAGGK